MTRFQSGPPSKIEVTTPMPRGSSVLAALQRFRGVLWKWKLAQWFSLVGRSAKVWHALKGDEFWPEFVVHAKRMSQLDGNFGGAGIIKVGVVNIYENPHRGRWIKDEIQILNAELK
jgi:hypothetical protein